MSLNNLGETEYHKPGLDLGDLSGFDLGAPGAADPLAMGGGPTLPAPQFPARPGAAGGYGARPKPPEKTSVWLIVAMAGGGGVAVITLLFILFMVFFRGGDELGGEAGEVAEADATNLLSRIRACVC